MVKTTDGASVLFAVLFTLVLAGGVGCGDDAGDVTLVGADAAASTAEPDAAGRFGNAEQDDDDDPGSGASDTGREREPADGNDGDDSDGDGEPAGGDDDDDAADAAVAPDDMDGEPEPEPDAGMLGDAQATTSCQALAECCAELERGPAMRCESVVEDQDEVACTRLLPTCRQDEPSRRPERCRELLECCAELEGRRRNACEAAANTGEGRACEQATEMFCM